MKKCPFCAEEIQDEAVVCRYCQRDLRAPMPAPAPAVAPPAAPAAGKKKTSPLAWGCLTVLIVMFVFAAWCGSVMSDIEQRRTSSTTAARSASPSSLAPAAGPVAAPAPVPAPQAKLALLSSRGYDGDYGYHMVEGQVRNISNEPLRNVTAQSTWLDKSGGFITSDDALIDLNPILPGQTSTFKTMSRTNPAMSKYSVEFKVLMGGSIETEDRRKK